jgi:lambda family phage portal protein
MPRDAQSLAEGAGGLPAFPGAIIPPPPAAPALDGAGGLTAPSAGLFDGVNGKERVAWATYAPAGAAGNFGFGYSGGFSPWANATSRDRTAATFIATDLMLSDPTVRSIVDTLTTNAIGTGLTLTAKVDPIATGITPDEARAVNHQIETQWAAYCNDPVECDGGGQFTVHEMCAQAFVQWLLNGECLTALDVAYAPGGTMATKIVNLDPRMLCMDRTMAVDGGHVFNGVEYSQRGRLRALWLRRIALGNFNQVSTPKRYAMRTAWGRNRFIFILERVLAGQIRGASPLLACLTPSRERALLNELSVAGTALQNSFSATVESAVPSQGALKGLEIEREPTDWAAAISEAAVNLRAVWYTDTKISLDAAKVVHLAPGDSLKLNQAAKIGPDYALFQKSLGLSAARASGVAPSDVIGFKDSNYASSRLEQALPHRLNLRRRKAVAERWMQDAYAAWLEESIAVGRIELPDRALPFWDARQGYTQAKWRGQGVVTADKKKDAEADSLLLANGIVTLEDVLAERGVDLETHIAQLKAEREMRKAAGLPLDYVTASQRREQEDEREGGAEDAPEGERENR